MSTNNFFKAFARTSALSLKTRKELFKVYTTLGVTLGSCAAGCYSAYHIPIFENNSIVHSLLIVGLALGIHIMKPTPGNLVKRTTMLWTLSWLIGNTLESFVSDMVMIGNWSILMMAGCLTSLMFAGFSVAVMSFESPKVVYFVGSSLTALSALSWVYVLGMFYPTDGVVNLILVIWLVSSCVCLISHMNRMLDMAQRGETLDPVVNAFLFFNSLISIFIRAAVLLSRDKRSKGNKNKKNKQRYSVGSNGIHINF
ncbi:hypothetical protein J3B02_002100 [Coemansia erecta]|nr:hypothetical protein J3B02_002100 [Coemansia erecta]